jgi:hypothetical protein
MTMQLKNLDRLSETTRQEIREQAARVRANPACG